MVSNYDQEFYGIDYKFKHGELISDEDYFLQLQKKESGASTPIIRFYGLEYNAGFIHRTAHFNDTTIFLNTLNLQLNDCYVFNNTECYVGWSEYKIKSFIWSKKMGLVVFNGLDGTRYELFNHIKSTLSNK